jgi:hypothetical protein
MNEAFTPNDDRFGNRNGIGLAKARDMIWIAFGDPELRRSVV